MATFDVGNVYTSYQPGILPEDFDANANTARATQSLCERFLSLYTGGNGTYTYKDELVRHRDHVTIDIAHVRNFSKDLAERLVMQPAEVLPLLEAAALEVLRQAVVQAGGEGEDADDGTNGQATKAVQVMLTSSDNFGPRSIREVQSEHVNQLVRLPGIVTAASKPRHKATHITVQCTSCKMTTTVACKPGMGGAMIPRACNLSQGQPTAGGKNDCGVDPFVMLGDRSKYVDQQTLKLQERPEDIPTGELPRTLLLVADRQLCGQVTPGTRVTITGIYSTFKANKGAERGAAALQQPYIRVVGISQEAGDAHSRTDFTAEEIAEFEAFARQPQLHDELFRGIAPKIYRSENIKKALACLLFGGSRKAMPDGTYRKGDVNVLLLGDPSTAKSQFLKFAAKVAPISVYTSGKGSSAAGLTATVVQDANTREFYLEGGAMVLADGGVVCIDEFDKMRPEDRVAIHEAMEQQTISIAKAGITTMLKSRTAVLAAANPPSGRYDDLKTAQDNIDLQTTILSRFDLIFIVKDLVSAEDDMRIARFVLDTHRLAGRGSTADGEAEAEGERFLKRYIHYARSRCFPRLSQQAQERLVSEYVVMRDEARRTALAEGFDAPPVPITVRQLEALVRLSESFARMALQTEVTLAHVAMALDLFKSSTMEAVKAGLTHAAPEGETLKQIQRLEERIRGRVHINGHLSVRRLVDDMVGLGESEADVYRALKYMVDQGDVQFLSERKIVKRLK